MNLPLPVSAAAVEVDAPEWKFNRDELEPEKESVPLPEALSI